MAVLLHLNGPPGVGKSSLAAHLVDEHQGALNLDIDRLVPLIGGSQHDFFGALEPARRLALGMAETHLRAGHDVVLPQLVASVAEAGRFERTAAEASATYVEVVLMAAAPVHIGRFREKSARSELDRHVAEAVDGEGGDALLERIHREFEQYVGLRPGALRIATDDLSLDRTYAAVLRALSEVTSSARDARH